MSRSQSKSTKDDTRRPPPASKTPSVATTDKSSPLSHYALLCERSHLFALGVLTLFAIAIHLRVAPLVSDVDSFYHLQHSAQYWRNGLFDSAFPWAQYSVVKTYAADIWYGFHILTIPLTFASTLVDGIYWGSLLTTIASTSLAFLAFRRLNLRWPLFWTLFFALICPDLLYRLTMLRPHPLSLGLNLLLFAYLVTRESRAALLTTFLVAAALGWLHLALVWLPVFMIALVSGVRLLHRQMPEWRKLAAFAAGLALGVILRPHALGALHLAYIQVVTLMVEKQSAGALGFGIELWPFYWVNFVEMFLPFTLLVLAAVGVLFLRMRDRGYATIDIDTRVAIWASLAMAIAFFILTFAVARRSHEVYFGFATIFLALVYQVARPAAVKALTAGLLVPAGVLFLAWTPFTIYRFDAIIEGAFDPRRFQAVGEWLHRNARPGEIVFNVHWDRFGELFFWNPQNYYINGMDPIFAYAYDPHLSWKNRYYDLDVVDEVTCGSFPCTEDQMVDTHTCLHDEFRASYIVIELERNPNLAQYLARAPGFAKVYESPTQVQIFQIN